MYIVWQDKEHKSSVKEGNLAKLHNSFHLGCLYKSKYFSEKKKTNFLTNKYQKVWKGELKAWDQL